MGRVQAVPPVTAQERKDSGAAISKRPGGPTLAKHGRLFLTWAGMLFVQDLLVQNSSTADHGVHEPLLVASKRKLPCQAGLQTEAMRQRTGLQVVNSPSSACGPARSCQGC